MKKTVKVFKHKCPHCPKTFEKPQGMGGHMSKAHPGVSKVYLEKMVTRDLRAPKRAILQKAKEMLLQRDPHFDLKNKRGVIT